MPIKYFFNRIEKPPFQPSEFTLIKKRKFHYRLKGGKYIFKDNSFNVSLNDKIYSKMDYSLESISFSFNDSISKNFSVIINSGYSIIENLNDYLWFHTAITFPKKIILDPGFYTGSELATHLENKLNNSYSNITFVVSYNNTSGLFTISPNSGYIKYLNVNTQQPLQDRDSIAGHLFGLNQTTDFVSTIISDTAVTSLNDSHYLINETNSSDLNYYYDSSIKLTLDDQISISIELNENGNLNATYNGILTVNSSFNQYRHNFTTYSNSSSIEVFPSWPEISNGNSLIYQLDQWDENGSSSAELTSLGITEPLFSFKWIGGVLGPNKKIYGIPYNDENILIVDTVTNIGTLSNLGANLSDDGKWTGGALGFDGKIYGIPLNSNDILIIDTNTNSATRSNLGANLSDPLKWYGGVTGLNGKIYGIPFNSTNILIIDTETNTATTSTLGASLTGSAKWIGGVLGKNGKIYGIPYDKTNILIIDTNTNSATTSNLGASLTGSAKWVSGVLGEDGKIYGIPYNSNDILIIDTDTNTATRSNLGANFTNSAQWSSGTIGSDGKIYGIPSNENNILIINTNTNTATISNLGANITGNAKFSGGVLSPNGKILAIPYEKSNFLEINTSGTGNNFSSFNNIILSPYFNKF